MKSVLAAIVAALAYALCACQSDAVSTSPSDQPEFSTDTLGMGLLWSGEISPTAMMMVYNRASKAIVLESVRASGEDAAAVSLNVDGRSGAVISGIEIGANDSIYLLAALTPRAPGQPKAAIDITCSGVTHSIPIASMVMESAVLRNHEITQDTSLGGNVRVFGSLHVCPGVTLSLAPGTVMWMHDQASVIVDGCLSADSATVRGDRTGYVAAGIPYEIMSAQWEGISVGLSGSVSLNMADISNSCSGISLGEGAAATMVNTRLSNSKATLVTLAPGATLSAEGCELTGSGGAIIDASAATVSLVRCTLANNYLFAVPSSALVCLDGASRLHAANCILYRPGAEVEVASDASCLFERCLFGSSGSDDDSFTDCIWRGDPRFRLDPENYLLDYRLSPGSDAAGAAFPAAGAGPTADRHGVPRSDPPSLGAYN